MTCTILFQSGETYTADFSDKVEAAKLGFSLQPYYGAVVSIERVDKAVFTIPD